MALDIPIEIDGLEEDEVQVSRTYALDLDNGRIAGIIDGIDAINQFIRKALNTPRFKCLIYDNQYGSEIKDRIMDKDVTKEFIEAEIPRLVEDALLYDDRMLVIYEFEFDFNLGKEIVHVKFKVDTVFGSTEIEEVI